MRGGRSSTTSAPTARCRSPDLLVVFKAARRQEYLQQNLRILSAPRGETVETAYGLRWQSPSVRRRTPEPGEEALIVFTSRPYRRFTPARFARVVSADRDEDVLRLTVELGSRARTTDPSSWQSFVSGGPNPSEASEVWIFRVEEDSASGFSSADQTPARDRPPVSYAEPGDDERAWRDSVTELAVDDDYRSAAFLRVASIRQADATAAPPLEPPYRLAVDRAYLLRVASLNPHLTADALREARVVPLYDELATAVVVDDSGGVPADGSLDVLVSPIVAGPGWLELNVSVGMNLVAATSIGWVAEGGVTAAADEAAAVPPEPLELPFAPADPVAEAAVRAYAVAEEAGLAPALRLRLLAALRAIVPGEPRLTEAEAIAHYEAGQPAAALRVTSGVPLDAISWRGRATLIAATLRSGHLPDPIDRVRSADLWRPEAAELVLEASSALDPGDQLGLSEFVATHVLSEERASDWYAAVSRRPLPAPARTALIDAWERIDPSRAAAARANMPPGGSP